MYRDTVTIFNRIKTAQGDTWKPTVLHDVNLNLDKGAVIKVYGDTAQDVVLLNVKLHLNGGTWIVSDGVSYEYMPPKEYQRRADKDGTITFTPGSAFDFFWCGEWESDNIISDDNYGDMSFYDWMNYHYDHVYAVSSVGEYSVIPHLEIAGK